MGEKKINKAKQYNFLQDYDCIRMMLHRMVLYDDCTIDDVKELDISVRRYKELKALIKAYIRHEDKNVRSIRVNGKKAFSLKNDRFSDSYNYLCDTYASKNIISRRMSNYIDILQRLSEKAKGGEVTEIASEKYILDELEDLGYIRIVRGGYRNDISLAADVLGEISTKEEAVRFLDMVSLMRNIVQPYLCGNMLFETALAVFREKGIITEYESPYILAQSHYEQVLDDAALWKLVTAMSEKKWVEFEYGEKKSNYGKKTNKGSDVDKDKKGSKRTIKAVPLGLVTHAESGRRYLLCADVNGRVSSRRLNRIFGLKQLNTDFDPAEYHDRLVKAKKYSFMGAVALGEDKLPQEVELEFIPKEKETVIRLFPDAVITDGDEFCCAKVFVNDRTEIKPWLRRHFGSIRVKDGTPLAEEMKQEADEWRAEYGLV